uniref:Ketoreductase domain-containing protein n=1 Tax=Zooxanthella nutricula TaxID=1333877 RepID=A0A6V0DG67_9DINO
MDVPKAFENFVKNKDGPVEIPNYPTPSKTSILVFCDAKGIAKEIIDAAPEGRFGTKKFVHDAYDMSPDDIKALITPKGGWGIILFACGLDEPESNAVAHVIDQNTRLLHLFFHVNQTIQRNEKSTKKFAVVTRGIFEEDPKVHKQVGLRITTASSLFGMCNTAREEMEEVDIQYVDMDWHPKNPEEVYAQVCSELLRESCFGHNSVRITRKGRFVMRQLSSKPYEAAQQEFPIPSSGTIAITGGNGALALVMGEWLLAKAEEQGAKGFEMKFLSRSVKISDANMPAWKRIEAKAEKMGIMVEQSKLDLSTQEATDEFIKAHSPNLIGIIHSAGVLQDGMLQGLSWEKCETVFDSKHRPALFLHGALERFPNPNLRFFWMFSSVAVYGSMGQWNYSGSNAFLDGLARYRRGRGKVATAIQWGAWGEVGMAANMDPAMRRRVEMGPFPYFKNIEGLAGLEAGLKTGVPVFSVFRMSAEVCFSWLAAMDTVDQCYKRNFWGEVIPSNTAPTLDRNHYNTIWRLSLGSYQDFPPEKKLIYAAYVQKKAEEHEKQWGDDFRQW